MPNGNWRGGEQVQTQQVWGCHLPGSDPRWPSSPSSYMWHRHDGQNMQTRAQKTLREGRRDPRLGHCPCGRWPTQGSPPWTPPQGTPLLASMAPGGQEHFACMCVCAFLFWADESTLSLIGFSEESVNYPERLRTAVLKGALQPTQPSSQSPSMWWHPSLNQQYDQASSPTLNSRSTHRLNDDDSASWQVLKPLQQPSTPSPPVSSPAGHRPLTKGESPRALGFPWCTSATPAPASALHPQHTPTLRA